MTALWMHFLAGIPMVDSPDRQPEWLKWGFVLTWLPSLQGGPEGTTLQTTYTVSLILFQPPVETLQRLIAFVQSPSWTEAMADPYVLVDLALLSWYHRIDKAAWDVNTLIRTEEQDIFRRTRTFRSTSDKVSAIAEIDLHRIHTSAKNAVFMIESLDSAIRLVDAALSDHEEWCGDKGSRAWLNIHRRLRHRGELFQSSRLRTVSSQARIKNTVDLVCLLKHLNNTSPVAPS